MDTGDYSKRFETLTDVKEWAAIDQVARWGGFQKRYSGLQWRSFKTLVLISGAPRYDNTAEVDDLLRIAAGVEIHLII